MYVLDAIEDAPSAERRWCDDEVVMACRQARLPLLVLALTREVAESNTHKQAHNSSL